MRCIKCRKEGKPHDSYSVVVRNHAGEITRWICAECATKRMPKIRQGVVCKYFKIQDHGAFEDMFKREKLT